MFNLYIEKKLYELSYFFYNYKYILYKLYIIIKEI